MFLFLRGLYVPILNRIKANNVGNLCFSLLQSFQLKLTGIKKISLQYFGMRFALLYEIWTCPCLCQQPSDSILFQWWGTRPCVILLFPDPHGHANHGTTNLHHTQHIYNAFANRIELNVDFSVMQHYSSQKLTKNICVHSTFLVYWLQ